MWGSLALWWETLEIQLPLELVTIRNTTQAFHRHDYRRKRNLNDCNTEDSRTKVSKPKLVTLRRTLRGSGSIAALQDSGGFFARENCGISRFQRLRYARWRMSSNWSEGDAVQVDS